MPKESCRSRARNVVEKCCEWLKPDAQAIPVRSSSETDQAALGILYSQAQYVPMRGRPHAHLEGPEKVTLAQLGKHRTNLRAKSAPTGEPRCTRRAAATPRAVQATARHHLLCVSDLGDPRQMSQSLRPPPFGKKTKHIVRRESLPAKLSQTSGQLFHVQSPQADDRYWPSVAPARTPDREIRQHSRARGPDAPLTLDLHARRKECKTDISVELMGRTASVDLAP